jgi:periplasmic protein TonB
VNALDRRHPSQRVYYRNVRVAMTVAILAHAAVFAFVPVPLAPFRPLGPDVLRVVEMSGQLLAGSSDRAKEHLAAPDDASPPEGVPSTDGFRAVEEPVRTTPASTEAGPSGEPRTGVSGAANGVADGGDMVEEGPEVFYAYDTAPRALRRVEPAYPPEARAADLDGTVVVNLNIDETGRILRGWVAQSNAPEILVAAALDAAYQFEFEPGTWRGAPVRCTVAIPFQFHLKHTVEVEGH